MSRETSIAAYAMMIESGALGRLHGEVTKTIAYNGPMTQMECTVAMGAKIQHSISPRFAELERLGVIHKVGTKICSVTGNLATLWDLTGRQPKMITKREKIEEAITKCEEKLARLREELEVLIECEQPVPCEQSAPSP